MNNIKCKRKSNIELLRIISILLIISFHYVFHSGYIYRSLSLSSFIIKSFYFNGETGVNLFLLITGYFMITKKRNLKKIILLFAELGFYCFFINISYILMSGEMNFGIFQMVKEIFLQTVLPNYWFFTMYVLIYILSPFINMFLTTISKRDYLIFLLTSLIIWSFLPTLFGLPNSDSEIFYYYNRFIWGIIIYSIGGYIRIFNPEVLCRKKKMLFVAGITYAIMLFSIFAFDMINNIIPLDHKIEVAYFWHPNSVPLLVLSVALFCIFKEIDINHNVVINMLASTTLGIYLLHDSIYGKEIWTYFFDPINHLNNNFAIVHIFLATALVFIIGSIIDLLRQFLETILLFALYNFRNISFIDKTVSFIVNKLKSIIKWFLYSVKL